MEIFLPHHTQGSQKQKYNTKLLFFVAKNVKGASIALKKKNNKKETPKPLSPTAARSSPRIFNFIVPLYPPSDTA